MFYIVLQSSSSSGLLELFRVVNHPNSGEQFSFIHKITSFPPTFYHRARREAIRKEARQ